MFQLPYQLVKDISHPRYFTVTCGSLYVLSSKQPQDYNLSHKQSHNVTKGMEAVKTKIQCPDTKIFVVNILWDECRPFSANN